MNATSSRIRSRAGRRIAATVVAVAALGLGATACGQGSGSGSDAAGSTGSSSSGSSSTGSSSNESGGKQQNVSDSTAVKGGSSAEQAGGARSGPAAKKAGGSGKAAAAAPNKSAAKTLNCSLSTGWNTGGDAAPDMHATQTVASIHFTNTGSKPCTLNGFPGVDLVGGKGTWSLQRSSAKHSSMTLEPGETTDFSITMLPAQDGSAQNFPVSSVRVTPPNSTKTVTLSWPWDGELVGQDGATHAGTYVGPVGAN